VALAGATDTASSGSAFSLPQHERLRLQAGNYSPVLLETKPFGCEPGAIYVLSWTRGTREVERAPVHFVTVTKVVRHRKGGWLIYMSASDYRMPTRFLRSTPPVWDPNGDRKPADEETEADLSSYTSSRHTAIDELEAVPRDYQQRISRKAFDRDNAMRLERVIANRISRGRARKERQIAARTLAQNAA
jgi:hypothetical protein